MTLAVRPSNKLPRLVCRWLACEFGMLGVADAALNQIARESARLRAPLPQNFDGFGVGLASNSTHLAVGAAGFFSTSPPFGAVHVFEYQAAGNPVLVKSIAGPQDSTDRRFGVSLAMGDDFLAVASFNPFDEDDNPRAVVDIHRADYPTPGAWGRVTRIQTGSANLAHGDQIVSVASNGAAAFAGFSSMEKVLMIGRGAGGADDWQVLQEIVAPDPDFADFFGTAVAVNGPWLAVGAPQDDEAGDDRGAVYLFRKTGTQWTFARKLVRPNTSTAYNLGGRVCLSGEWLAAGNSAGDVLIYRLSEEGEWSLFQEIGLPFYGYEAFDLKDGELLCGSPYSNGGASSSGLGHLFGFNSDAGAWQKRAELRTSQPGAYGLMGGAALITGSGYLLGSGLYRSSISGTTVPPGTCHLFDRPVLESYASWVQRVFPAAQQGVALAQPGAVMNQAGISNWLSYAMGLDPFSPEPSRLPHVEFDPADQRWGFRFQVRPNAEDFSWRAVSSGNLQGWSTFNGSTNRIGYGAEVQEHFPKVSPAAGTRQFFRLEITPLAP